jgi:hypothetical protein
MHHTQQLLDYLATQKDAILTYNASNMILAVHSNASHLSELKARSQAGGFFFLFSNTPIPPNNGAVLNIAHIIKHVMSSATEAELADYTLWLKRQYKSESSLKKWDTNSPPHCYKLTTQWLKL